MSTRLNKICFSSLRRFSSTKNKKHNYVCTQSSDWSYIITLHLDTWQYFLCYVSIPLQEVWCKTITTEYLRFSNCSNTAVTNMHWLVTECEGMITVHPAWSAFCHILISKGIWAHNHVCALNFVRLENSKSLLSTVQLPFGNSTTSVQTFDTNVLQWDIGLSVMTHCSCGMTVINTDTKKV